MAKIDEGNDQNDNKMKLDSLMAAAGVWKDRTDLPDVRKMRKEWDVRAVRILG